MSCQIYQIFVNLLVISDFAPFSVAVALLFFTDADM